MALEDIVVVSKLNARQMEAYKIIMQHGSGSVDPLTPMAGIWQSGSWIGGCCNDTVADLVVHREQGGTTMSSTAGWPLAPASPVAGGGGGFLL
ncbi:hypothetical protein RJ639_023953 [Escallonia herrerae]|uniref:Uncharacterized protein n=1 Tax=Escallonia herrerae TaxID=1293975 RepID=A0AA89AC46_9ASTE|nr:hypothetical protein RJ639_023953 [Escallonia herrerae]